MGSTHRSSPLYNNNNTVQIIKCISVILCFVYVFVCFYCSVLFNCKVSIHLARVDVSAGNSLSTPQY